MRFWHKKTGREKFTTRLSYILSNQKSSSFAPIILAATDAIISLD